MYLFCKEISALLPPINAVIIYCNCAFVISVVVEEPEFADVIENITVAAGRNVKFACSVKNLGTYKVSKTNT